MREIVLIGGFPGAGKSTLVSQYPDYERLNRDILGGSVAEVALKLDSLIVAGKTRFVLDNTYGTREHRKTVLDVGAKHNIPVRMIWMSTTIEEAQVNACTRMIRTEGRLLGPGEFGKTPNAFPPSVLFKFGKEHTRPDKSEGFSSVTVHEFVRTKDPTYKKKALILDYDGTLRKTKSGAKYPTDVNDIHVFVERAKVIKKYSSSGYKILGVSNQSGIAKGNLSIETARACFDFTNKALGVDIDFAFCPHGIGAGGISCFCRKPMPGLGVQFIEKYKLDPSQTIMVGDMTTDHTFAKRCGFSYSDQLDFFIECS